MTYEEIKRRLVKCEKSLKLIKQQDLSDADLSTRQKVQKDLKVLNENITKYKSLLLKEEKTYILTPKSGKPTAASLGDDEVDALKDADDIAAIKGADGEEIKEQDGINFSIEETKAIAKKVGKAVAMSLKAMGDAVTSMKAIRIEENSFEIKVLYKNGSDDEFSFYISEDKLHLQDFSFDKELVDVGVKPSGEAVVNVDVLSNELQKHFKSLSEDVNEMNYSNYTEPKHFDICPGAEALRKELLDSGKTAEELGEWTYRHDQLFKLEKDVLKSNEAGIKHVIAAEKLRSAIIHLSRDLGIDANKVHYLKGHVDKIQDVRLGKNEGLKSTEKALKQLSKDLKGSSQAHLDQKKKLDKLIQSEGEGDDHHYIKVPKAQYKKAMSILDNNAEPSFVKMDTVDDDGAGNVIIYFQFNEFSDDFNVDEREAFMYDAVQDLQAQDIDIADHSAELDENVKEGKIKPGTYAGRAVVVHMNGPETEWKVEFVKSGKVVDYADAISNLKFDDDTTPTDYMQRRKAEKDYQQEEVDADGYEIYEPGTIAPKNLYFYDRIGKLVALDDIDGLDLVYKKGDKIEDDQIDEDTDVGHQDDEPSMLKNTAYESATYAAKLYKKLAKYDQHDGEVDFPNWWQSKLILAKDYLSKAFHYLDSEEKQPMLDKLALEEGVNEATDLYDRNGIMITRFAGGKDRGLMVQITYDGKYIQVPADEFAILARAMQSVIGDIRDMTLQMPRKNYPKNEALDSDLPKGKHSIAKLQKVHGMIVDKMKELAKLYKKEGGDYEYNGHPVIDHLKSLTKKKKQVEAALDKAVSDKGKGQQLAEIEEYEVDDAIAELGDIIRDIDDKAEEAREIVRQVFPNELSRLDSYGAFNMTYSNNRYDVTLGKFVERLEEEGYEIDDDGDVNTLEGKYKSDAQRKAIYAAKAEKNEAGPGFKHDCAAKVIHKEHGAGTCIPEKHTLVKEGNKYVVTHYDVLFESGKTVEDIPVSELEIKTQNEHWHKGYKKKKK